MLQFVDGGMSECGVVCKRHVPRSDRPRPDGERDLRAQETRQRAAEAGEIRERP